MAGRWVAFFRIYIGALWFEYGTSKLEPAWAAPKGEFYDASKFAASTVHGPIRAFIETVVLPHQQIFALLVAFGETLVGISLVLGLLTRIGAAGGMFLSASYFLAQGKYQQRFGLESLELLLFVCCLMLLALHSENFLSLDSWLAKHFLRRPADVAADPTVMEGYPGGRRLRPALFR
ncbi:MAG TPA: TQO small subunit DoxD [Candidatus Baltobacteraceae bacterium]|nr:TQO small subunit DoxD [Candidatus Baltobacteraceae bacterium]